MKRFCLVLTVLTAAACGGQPTPTDPSPNPTPSNAVIYTAVGASDAIGFGGTAVCIPFTECPDGSGYVQRIVRRFKVDGRTVAHTNLGIPGAVLSPELQSLGNSLGRDIFANFLEREMPFVPRDSTVVTIFAGGNDANTIGAAVEAGLGSPNPSAYAATLVANWGRDVRALVAGIRARAPGARIVALNLPNMAALPYAAGYSLARKQYLQQIAVGISAEVNKLAADGVHVVDLMCDGTFYQPSTFSADGFHPNDAGYAYMADLVYPIAAGAAAVAPRASCSRMTVY